MKKSRRKFSAQFKARVALEAIKNDKPWEPVGNELKMSYTLPHFMGYRFALFNYATKEAGGYVAFDDFQIEDQ